MSLRRMHCSHRDDLVGGAGRRQDRTGVAAATPALCWPWQNAIAWRRQPMHQGSWRRVAEGVEGATGEPGVDIVVGLGAGQNEAAASRRREHRGLETWGGGEGRLKRAEEEKRNWRNRETRAQFMGEKRPAGEPGPKRKGAVTEPLFS